MAFLPWWMSGLALAGVMLTHWLLTQRMMAVSGRFTALVNRFRFSDEPEPDDAPLTEEELMAAIQAATFDAFGDTANLAEEEAGQRSDRPGAPDEATRRDASEAPRAPSPASLPSPTDKAKTVDHLIFLGALPIGALVASASSNNFQASQTLASPGFTALFGDGVGALVALLAGGVLVGFGTRMAGGCTSGHGLCGVSRLQAGSLLATAAFFGAGIAASFLLGAL